jgi:hypothetical protein
MRFDMKRMIGRLNPPGPAHIVVSRRDVAQMEIVQAISHFGLCILCLEALRTWSHWWASTWLPKFPH